MTNRFCTNCGTPHGPGHRFCTECGTHFEPAQASPAARAATAILSPAAATPTRNGFRSQPRWAWTLAGIVTLVLVATLWASAARRVGIDDYARAWGMASRAEQYDVCEHFVLDVDGTWDVTSGRNPGLERAEWVSFLSRQCGSTWDALITRFPDQYPS